MREGDGTNNAAEVVVGRTVFLSYASHDTEIANTVCRELESRGIRCWIAPRDVAPGALYADAIVRAINESKVLLIVLSQSAVASSHVGKEVERASSKHKQIIALRIDAASLTPALEYFLSESQWVDIPALGMQAALGKIADVIRAGPASGTSDVARDAAGTTAPPAPNKGRSPLTIGIIAAAGLVTAAGCLFLANHFHWVSREDAAAIPAAPSETSTAKTVLSEKSIAVLPFTDMSEKHDQEYFSDGMAEEIIDLLVKIPELVVPARTSSFYFKGKSTQIPEIAKQLGVRNILEGSVRKSGNHLRVTAQLVRADNGYHLWSETYNSTVEDVFKTQDEIAGAVVGALKVTLLNKDAPSAKLTTSTEAYELYLQSKSLIYRGTSDDTLRAYANLQKAVTLDPNFALAYATLATLLAHDNVAWDLVLAVPAETKAQIQNGDYRGWDQVLALARVAAHAAAERAIKLAPDLAESHAALALVLSWLDGNWKTADIEMRRALELDPGNARITFMAADLAGDLGRISEALQLAIRANSLDPLGDSHILGWLQYVNGNLDQAESAERRIIQLYPTAERVHFHRAIVLLAQGKTADALTELELEPVDVFRDAGRPLVLDSLGRRAEADQALALAEEKDGGGMAYQIAYIYAARKNPDRTFYWLERAYNQHDGGLSDLKIDPYFRSLRNDPRYKSLLRKVGLPD
jgi:TolB-like protein/tetratricopeptide (TPR) repeat protein